MENQAQVYSAGSDDYQTETSSSGGGCALYINSQPRRLLTSWRVYECLPMKLQYYAFVLYCIVRWGVMDKITFERKTLKS